jgi:hypothetical protein
MHNFLGILRERRIHLLPTPLAPGTLALQILLGCIKRSVAKTQLNCSGIAPISVQLRSVGFTQPVQPNLTGYSGANRKGFQGAPHFPVRLAVPAREDQRTFRV